MIIVDWSATSGPTKPGRDTIWIGSTDATGVTARHMPTRPAAEAYLADAIQTAQGQRLLIGLDFAFGYPKGLATRLTGHAYARHIWRYLADRIQENSDFTTNRFDVARTINRTLGGPGPFWVVNKGLSDPDLPLGTKGRDGPESYGIAAHRAVERHPDAGNPKSVWQLTGPGAVGSQSLTGLPMIHRLSQIPGVSVWPFESALSDIVLAEVYPSLLAKSVAGDVAAGWVQDAAQVRLLSLALFSLARSGQMPKLFDLAHPDPEEGWILGVGHSAALKAALQ